MLPEDRFAVDDLTQRLCDHYGVDVVTTENTGERVCCGGTVQERDCGERYYR